MIVTQQVTPEQLEARHHEMLEAFKSERLDSFAIGGLGLAAWTVIFTIGDKGGLHRYTVQLLFVGAALAILGPVLFRAGGALGARNGLEITVSIGYAGLTLALASAVDTALHPSAVKSIGVIVAILIVAREIAEVKTEIAHTNRILSPLRGGQAGPGVASVVRHVANAVVWLLKNVAKAVVWPLKNVAGAVVWVVYAVWDLARHRERRRTNQRKGHASPPPPSPKSGAAETNEAGATPETKG